MLAHDRFSKVLIEPSAAGGDHISIISGYASPAFASYHLEALPKHVTVDVIIGMCALEGMGRGSHLQFTNLAGMLYPGRFQCRYVKDVPPVHSKIYVWSEENRPIKAFTGSANYSHNGFLNYREGLAEDSPAECPKYYNDLLTQTIECTHSNVTDEINLYDDRVRRRRAVKDIPESVKSDSILIDELSSLQKETLSLLTRSDDVGDKSGLNWGQREKRDKDQAYISIPSDISMTDFFPPLTRHFTVITDDGQTIICVRAQQNAKAIHSRPSNAILGKYFRDRLGLASGTYVTKEHLIKYGRTDVDMFKISDDYYYLDFSV